MCPGNTKHLDIASYYYTYDLFFLAEMTITEMMIESTP